MRDRLVVNYRSIYLIGSLRNARIPQIATRLRTKNTEVFENWYSAGSGADDAWRDYERGRGHTYEQALSNHSAKHVYAFDHFHLNRCHAAVLALPAGRSGHTEAGFMSGQGKPVFMLLDEEGEPERLDVMSQFFSGVFHTVDDVHTAIDCYSWPKIPLLPFFTVMDASWLAGLWEGDGTFCLTGNVPRMLLQMSDYDVIERAASIMKTNVWKQNLTVTGKRMWGTGCNGLTAVEWMRIIRPYMGQRRQKQIRCTVQGWLSRRKYRQQDKDWWLRMFNLQERVS